MTDLTKATRAIVRLGAVDVEGFMLPDGDYRMSLSQSAELAGKPARSTFDFLRSKALKRLLQEAGATFDFLPATTLQALSDDTYTADQFAVDIGTEGNQGQTRIRGIPLEIITLYWQWEAFRGNKQAFLLVTGFATESLERRFDAAFGVTRLETEYNDRLTQRQQHLEQTLTRLGEAYALDDDLRQRVEYLERFCRERGLDPWSETKEPE